MARFTLPNPYMAAKARADCGVGGFAPNFGQRRLSYAKGVAGLTEELAQPNFRSCTRFFYVNSYRHRFTTK